MTVIVPRYDYKIWGSFSTMATVSKGEVEVVARSVDAMHGAREASDEVVFADIEQLSCWSSYEMAGCGYASLRAGGAAIARIPWAEERRRTTLPVPFRMLRRESWEWEIGCDNWGSYTWSRVEVLIGVSLYFRHAPGAKVRQAFVANPDSEAIAASLERRIRATCPHKRNPCLLRCGVRRNLGQAWEVIPYEERRGWLQRHCELVRRDADEIDEAYRKELRG